MNTDQINRFLKRRVPYFVGTFPKNTIPYVQKRPAMFVVNTHPSSKPGEHWVAVILINHSKAEYFDSFGFPALDPEIRNYLTLHSMNWQYSPRTLQHPLAATCGVFCCLFLLYRACGRSYDQFREIFSLDLEQNESLVLEIYEAHQLYPDWR